MLRRHLLFNVRALTILAVYLCIAICSGQATTVIPASTESTLSYLKGPATWSAAESYCASQGGHLASILSAEENQQAKVLCTDLAGCWIGLNNQSAGGTYVWIDGSTSTYTAWATAQPDGDTNITSAEDCVLYAVDTTTAIAVGWNDRPCSEQHGYLCKLPVVALSLSALVTASPAPTNNTASSNITSSFSNTTTAAPTDSTTGSTASALSEVSKNSSTSIATVPGASSPATTAATPTAASTDSSSPASSPVASADSSSPASSPATSLTGSVTSQRASEGIDTSSLAGSVISSASSDQGTNATSTQTSGRQKDTWKLVLSIVVPVLTGSAALITIGYTGWKWWHKRQATLMTKRMAHRAFASTISNTRPPALVHYGSVRSQNSGVKPLIPVGSDRIV